MTLGRVDWAAGNVEAQTAIVSKLTGMPRSAAVMVSSKRGEVQSSAQADPRYPVRFHLEGIVVAELRVITSSMNSRSSPQATRRTGDGPASARLLPSVRSSWSDALLFRPLQATGYRG